MVRIVHFSDWHGEFSMLPKADIYVCTGDILPNDPKLGASDPFGYSRCIDHEHEARFQMNWFERNFALRGKTLRKFFASYEAPLIIVRGNHDFVDLAPLFGGETYEIADNPTVTFDVSNIRFGGFRGIGYIAGEWSDELREHDLDERAMALPDVDVVVTHTPPAGILDLAFGVRIGCGGLTRLVNEGLYGRRKLPKLFCFGHCHGCLGGIEDDNGVMFSNAATHRRVIDLEI